MLIGSCEVMTENNNSNRTLYSQALQGSSSLSEDTYQQLIASYPYSQPLRWAYERRKYQEGDLSPTLSLALLYSPSPSWFFTFVNNTSPLQNAEDASVSFDDVSGEDDFNKLLSHGGLAMDYFVFEEKTQEVIADAEEEVLEQKEDESDDVSLYNDDLMPYSFRWWLHKTRLEHATTYQPFANVRLPAPAKGQFDLSKLEEDILDQQIKESIIHFQDPEAKLSEQVKSRPVEVTTPKKTDKIIDQFILEEPIIQPPTAESLNNENMARKSAEDNYVFVTETLANVYLDQGLFQKAIEVFRKLILKYPEKKSYFGDQIQKIEKNI